MNRLDPLTWKLPPDRTQDARRNLERLRKFAMRVKELRPGYVVELVDSEPTDGAWLEIHICKGDQVLATIAADEPNEGDFLSYPFDDEDGKTVSTAEEAVEGCDCYAAEAATRAARRRAAKWWQFWKR